MSKEQNEEVIYLTSVLGSTDLHSTLQYTTLAEVIGARMDCIMIMLNEGEVTKPVLKTVLKVVQRRPNHILPSQLCAFDEKKRYFSSYNC